MTVIVILSYGARYEVPVFTKEQALSYIKYYNEDNGCCYLYTSSYEDQDLKDLANEIFDSSNALKEFINKEREDWINRIKDRNIPSCYHHISDFKLESIFTY